MNYGPNLPPTGGGLLLAGSGIVWGASIESWPVIAISIIGFCIMTYGLYRVLKGQRRIESQK